MEIVLNGAAYQLDEAKSVTGLVADLHLTDKAIAVAVNRHVIARHKWDECHLQMHDRVDVVRAIGGG